MSQATEIKELGLLADSVARPVGNPPSAHHHRARVGIVLANFAYLLLIAAVWMILRFEADHWWLATLLLFGPRWLLMLPLLPLAIASAIWNRRSLLITAFTSAIVIFPIMDFCIPWRVPLAGSGFHLKILTCNIHRHNLSADAMSQIIEGTKPDIVVMQEWTSKDQGSLFGNGSWFMRRDDELFIASRYPIQSAEDIFQGKWGGIGAAVSYRIELPGRTINFVNVHLASPHSQFEAIIYHSPEGPELLEANSKMRAEQSALLAGYTERSGDSTILAGDFNTPGNSPLFGPAWSGLSDGFANAGFGLGNTYFTKFVGMRIDHVISASGWSFSGCSVGPAIGSPHRPLVADLNWNGQGG
jgi:endonuclease/exonuclease/phosphatase (EEP) superfamily protein YafD